MNRFVLAAPFSGAGKTTLTLAFLRFLRRKGVAVQPFKVGPDFVDPRFHDVAAHRVSHNLDPWMCESIVSAIVNESCSSDWGLIEGVMGLYDGVGATEQYSTAHLAKMTYSPVILVVPAAGMGASVAAMVDGYVRGGADICGVMLTKVSGQRHADLLTEALKKTGVPVMGWMPNLNDCTFGHRGIGLVLPDDLETKIERLADGLEGHVDVELLKKITDRPALSDVLPPSIPTDGCVALGVGIGFDATYPLARRWLEQGGLRWVEFDVRRETIPPEADGLWLRWAGEGDDLLQVGEPFIESLSNFQGPIWAEGLGAMVLGRCYDDGRQVKQLSCRLDWVVRPTSRFAAFGYVTVEGEVAYRGHEYRKYDYEGQTNLFSRRLSDQQVYHAGFCGNGLWAVTAHGHPLTQPDLQRYFELLRR